MRAPTTMDDPEALDDPLLPAVDDVDGAPATGAPAEDTEELLEPGDEADDLQLILTDGPPVRGRGKHGKAVYSFTFTHPGPSSIARGLCSPSDITKAETMERVKKAYEACGFALRETAVFREPHLNSLPHDAVLCRTQKEHRWLPVCQYMYQTWRMRMGASKHIATWSDGCRYPRLEHRCVFLSQVLDPTRRARPRKKEGHRKVKVKKRTPG